MNKKQKSQKNLLDKLDKFLTEQEMTDWCGGFFESFESIEGTLKESGYSAQGILYFEKQEDGRYYARMYAPLKAEQQANKKP